MNYHYSSHLYQDTMLLSLFCALITTVESRWLIENRDLSLAFWTQGSQSNSSSQQLMGLCVESSEGGGERGRRGWTFVLLKEKLSGAKEKDSQELNPHNPITIIICLLKTLILHISTPPTSGNTFKPLHSFSLQYGHQDLLTEQLQMIICPPHYLSHHYLWPQWRTLVPLDADKSSWHQLRSHTLSQALI